MELAQTRSLKPGRLKAPLRYPASSTPEEFAKDVISYAVHNPRQLKQALILKRLRLGESFSTLSRALSQRKPIRNFGCLRRRAQLPVFLYVRSYRAEDTRSG
jgi:hypothetical protein